MRGLNSDLLQQAMECLLRWYRDQDMTERYIRTYRQNPETKGDIEFACYAALISLF